MAPHIPILSGALPDTSAKVWWEPYDVLATNDVWKHLVLRFDEDGNNDAALTTRVGAYGKFVVPHNYVGTPKVVFLWCATITTANATVVWDFEYRTVAGDQTESYDQAGNQESVTGSQDVADAANERRELLVTLTAGNFVAGDEVEYFVASDGTDGADDAACARILQNLLFEFEDA